MSTHSPFSPSASHRVLMCPPSLKLNAAEPDTPSPFAEEGTSAHELCAYLVEKALGRDVADPTPSLKAYDEEMQTCAEEYRDFVIGEYEQAKLTCPDPQVLIEQHVDISHWVPGCGGIADCVILSDNTAEVIDYKHGLGVMVSAETEEFGGNPQLMCYALGVLDMYDGIYDISTIKTVIFQPRKENVSMYTLTREELLAWAEERLRPTAEMALNGEGEFCAGEHCRFCKVKAKCRKRAEYNLTLAKYDFEMPQTLLDDEIDVILTLADGFIEWLNDVKDFALSEALSGKEYEHHKLVEGRSVRKYTSDDDVARVVTDAGYDPYEKKVLGITAMTKLLGKQKFDDLLKAYITKPAGKPTLVSRSDKRPALRTEAKHDFKGE